MRCRHWQQVTFLHFSEVIDVINLKVLLFLLTSLAVVSLKHLRVGVAAASGDLLAAPTAHVSFA